jgi:alpha-glucan,water dikinase
MGCKPSFELSGSSNCSEGWVESMTEEIIVNSGVKILVDKRVVDDRLELSLNLTDTSSCRLHWGFSRSAGARWKAPPHSDWPAGSISFSDEAVQTPFSIQNGGNRITIRIDKRPDFSFMNFALYYPESDTWVNNQGKNFKIKLAERQKSAVAPDDVIREEMTEKKVLFESDYDMDYQGSLSVAVAKDGGELYFALVSDINTPLILHWGVALKSPFEWVLPDSSIRPPGTEEFDEKAVQTAFAFDNALNRLTMRFRERDAPVGIPFVLYLKEDDIWLNNKGRNFYVPLMELQQGKKFLGPPHLEKLAREIVQAEMGRDSWTLMHRFNLCHDLLDRSGSDEDGLALIFVWMRYSFLRQLDWQRNYNTKPSELAHSQDRLTLKLARIYISEHRSREFVTLIMSTLGRGGEGQRIRDEILHIMHRHHIKEVAGHFMEEWHQKLHNNTTPDDIVICEAYIEFLRSSGDHERFYGSLEAGGVTRERLETFERPIRSRPDFLPDLKDELIRDFENFLRLLKSVHSGTDLETAAGAADYIMDYEMRGPLQNIFQYRDDSAAPLVKVAGSVTELRRLLKEKLNSDRNDGRVRDMIYLDLALEEFLRVVVERNIHTCTDRDELIEVIRLVLRNQRYSYDNFELAECDRHWQRLAALPRFDQDWSLHARSVLDRLGRAISGLSDRLYDLLQDKAVSLGTAFHAAEWMMNMFSEEVVRGRLSFILSLLVHHLDPTLRESAQLGDWQVISRGEAAGVIEVVDSLSSIQGTSFETPTIVIAEKVRGDEEPVRGLKAVITPDLVDLVAHVSIRARNSQLLFATCYDRQRFEDLKSLKGQRLRMKVSPSGDVVIEPFEGELSADVRGRETDLKTAPPPRVTDYAIASREFSEERVGGKSLNLVHLATRLPDWVRVPVSVAVPFGVFEEVLSLDMNRNVAERCTELLGSMEENPEERLSEVRNVLLGLEPPGKLVSSLRIVIEDAGIAWPDSWVDAWMCIKRVWASKWNERAYVSRRSRGIPHEGLFMAVLIQQVVKAEYAFVIHTTNPYTGDAGELYAEIVPGLGETLVGNYPGRALGFTSSKVHPEPRLVSYPSKSTGLSGGGLIFRSDSNGEDLADYAGAGLYDSVMLDPPREVPLNYADERIVWDGDFRKYLLVSIAKIGTELEQIMGAPQDIEGAYANEKFYVVQTRPQV